MKKIGNILSNLIIIVLILTLAFVIISKLCFGIEMKAVLTASMEPEISVGSLVIINPTAYEDINIGDDITFVRDKNLTLVTHRVIEKNDETQYITTQGIANNAPDNPTIYANVVGKVVCHIPYIGYFIIWTSTLKGKIICGIIIASLVAFSILISTNENQSKRDGEKNKQLKF